MSENLQRIIAAGVLVLIGAGIATAQYFGFPAVRYAAMLVVLCMIIELITCLVKSDRKKLKSVLISFIPVFILMALMLVASYYVGNRPWIMLLLLMTIVSADVGAWFFGKLLGGDKMWERLSKGKTWSGQIAGIACGTFASIMYGLLGTDTFMPQLLWIGISVSLLSQYGDITASWVKRKLNIKDFGTLIPGHGGIFDRFDGWIYVLPIVWLVML